MRFKKFRTWLISKIANGEPIIMNFRVHQKNIPDDCCLILIQSSPSSSSSSIKPILTPLNSGKVLDFVSVEANNG